MDEDELKRRTFQFALRAMKLAGALPNTIEGRTIGRQLCKAGTSVGANYRAACSGRSVAEFIAKLGIVEEEADESAFWMELIIAGGLLKEKLAAPLLQEAVELAKIMASSKKTAGRRARRPSNGKSQMANRKSTPAEGERSH